MIRFKDPVAEHIKAFILDETAMQIENREYDSDPAWRDLRERGSRIWLHGCDHKAAEVWSGEMEAICADTSQIIAAVQRGEYDRLIEEAVAILKGLPEEERLAEIVFIVSARHAVKLSKRFAARVSIEVSGLPGGAEELLQYGRRLFQVCPEHILIALPYSAEGLAAGADLARGGVPVTIDNLYGLSQMVASRDRVDPAYLAVNLAGRPDRAAAILRRFAVDELTDSVPRLIAEGIENAGDIELLAGFPILKLTPDAALRYKNGGGAPSTGDSAGTAASVSDPAEAEELSRRYLRRRTDDYRRLSQAVAQAIHPN